MPCVNHPDVLNDLSTCTRCGKTFCADCIISLRGAVVCAGCKGEAVQDVKSGAVEGELAFAGRGARLGAAIIDNLILGIPMAIVFFLLIGGAAFGAQGQAVVPVWFTFAQYGLPLIMVTAYEGWMLSSFGGQTLGKKALGIKVVAPDGGDLTPGQAWGRGLSRVVMSLTQILGLIDSLFIFSKNRTTLHDRIVKTRVVTAKG
jgi:uncharacterized RDD family membrane protein YckC